ncbi:MAG: hypothetical protein JWN78_630 [Bacteroidota bacterium]|nr:hypothetical protein [Bacteroidota bacterium]
MKKPVCHPELDSGSKMWRKFILLFFIFNCLLQHARAQFVESEQCIGGNGRDEVIDVQSTADNDY